MKRLTLVVIVVSAFAAWQPCQAGDGAVSGDTRYKYAQREKVSESPRGVRRAERRQTREVAPRREVGTNRPKTHWYYSRARDIPWWPNAPGD
jgi:hypothetical protein